MNDPESPATPPLDEPAVDEPTVGPNIDFTDPNSPLAKYYFQASHVLATMLIVGVFFFFNLMAPLGHSDVWGHLKIGAWIVENRQLPARELFSDFSDPTLPASNFQWLPQAIMSETYRAGAWLAGGSPLNQTAGGVDLLRALHALLEAAKAFFLLLAFRRFTGSLPFAIGGVVLVFFFILAASAVLRPQVFAEVLFAAILWLMARPLVADAPARTDDLSWRRTFVIVGLLVLWTNVHGSFLMGIGLVGVLWLGRMLESMRDRGLAATLRDAPLQRPFVAVALGTILLSILNPHGLRAIPDVLAFAKNRNVLTMQEWQPLNFSAGGGGHWGYLVLLVVIALTQIVSPRIYAPTQLLILAVFGVAPLMQERLMTWWIMLVPVVILPMWADLVVVSPAARERWTSVLSLRKTIIAGGIVFVGLVWSSLTQLVLGHPPVPIHLSVSQATLWPITDELLLGKDAESPADQKTLSDNPLAKSLREGLKNYPSQRFRGGIFTAEAMGDYLVWSLPPKAPVMVHSHVHVFPPDYWDDYMEVLFARPGWRYVLDRHGVNLVVCQVEQRQDLLAQLKEDPDWVVILDQSEQPMNRWYRLFVALRKKPLAPS